MIEERSPGTLGFIDGFWVRRLPIVAIGLGAAIRAEQFLFRRSLCLDELTLSLNIVGRSYAKLVEPLDLNQIAPLGFLWIQRFWLTVAGNNEYALRLFPLLSSLASLLLFHRLARRLLSVRVAPVATILFALSPIVISYANEAKQYSSDVLAALLVLNAGHSILRALKVRTLSALGFALLGAAVIWISHPVVFVLAGVGATVLLTHLLARRWRDAALLAVACSAWAVSLLASLGIAYRNIEAHQEVVDFWRALSAFPPEGGSLVDGARWLGERAGELMKDPVGLSFTGLGLIVCGFGIASFVRRRRGVDLVLLCSAIPFTVLASVVRVYPLRWRLLLFLVPIVVMLLAASLEWMGSIRHRLATAAFLIPLTVVAVAPARTVWQMFNHPPERQEARPVFEYVAKHWRTGDALYVHWFAEAAYLYYGPTLELEATGIIVGTEEVPCQPSNNLASFKQAGRVWMVFTHRMARMPANERAIVRSFLDVVARPVGGFVASDAAAYLYDPHGQPVDPAGNRVQYHPLVPCIGVRAPIALNT